MQAWTADLWAKQDQHPGDRHRLFRSLHAGPVSQHCTNHLRVGGVLLANPSHDDAALASIDPRYDFVGIVRSASGRYSVRVENPGSYLVPKKDVEVSAELVERTGRGVTYTKSAFAYLFRRVE